MDELMDMIAADDSASQVSDQIKDLLFTKSAEYFAPNFTHIMLYILDMLQITQE